LWTKWIYKKFFNIISIYEFVIFSSSIIWRYTNIFDVRVFIICLKLSTSPRSTIKNNIYLLCNWWIKINMSQTIYRCLIKHRNKHKEYSIDRCIVFFILFIFWKSTLYFLICCTAYYIPYKISDYNYCSCFFVQNYRWFLICCLLQINFFLMAH
jgi:hypothetical protein